MGNQLKLKLGDYDVEISYGDGCFSFTTYKNGVKDGLEVDYERDFDGDAIRYSECKDGEDDGISKYIKNEKPVYEMLYKDGKLSGVSKYYYKNGKLEREVNYKDDKEDGIEKQYRDNGTLWKKTQYKKGKIVGKQKEYDEEGNFYREIKYIEKKIKDKKHISSTWGEIAMRN